MAPPSLPPSLYPTDSIRDVAESLGLNPPSSHVAAGLAADVEYRIRSIVQDAQKYMRHARRSQLRSVDIDRALRARNIEPLYGFLAPSLGRSTPSSNAPGASFRRVQTTTGPLHYVEDPEIDLEVLPSRTPIARGAGVGWAAHWLAVEGVQPAIPQNPTRPGAGVASASAPAPSSDDAAAVAGATGTTSMATSSMTTPQVKPLIKHALSRELQLYFERLTVAVLSVPLPPAPDASASLQASEETAANSARDAALAALRGDAGLAQLLPYLVQWIGEQVTIHLRTPDALEVLLRTTGALLGNPTLLIEPYLHQLLPALLSVQLCSSLPSSPKLRAHSASLLRFILTQYGSAYPSLRPRVLRTLQSALLAGCTSASEEAQHAGPRESIGTKVGAIVALRALGAPALKSMLLEKNERPASPLTSLGEWLEKAQSSGVEDTQVLVQHIGTAVQDLAPSYVAPAEDDEAERGRVETAYGAFWARTLNDDVRARKGLLSVLPAGEAV